MVVFWPCAKTSGFILLSAVGPKELKLAIFSSALTAPILNTEDASAGAPTYLQELVPLFPAEFTKSYL